MELTIEKKIPNKNKKAKIPEYLIKEVINGIPYYYKGYREVLNKTKTLEDIMGCSGLQSIIIEYLMLSVCIHLDRKKYRILTNEPGNHLGPKDNLSYDMAIFDKTILVPEKVTYNYVDVPPELIVEVDLRVELKDTEIQTFEEFIILKTSRVFEFGVKKLICTLIKWY